MLSSPKPASTAGCKYGPLERFVCTIDGGEYTAQNIQSACVSGRRWARAVQGHRFCSHDVSRQHIIHTKRVIMSAEIDGELRFCTNTLYLQLMQYVMKQCTAYRIARRNTYSAEKFKISLESWIILHRKALERMHNTAPYHCGLLSEGLARICSWCQGSSVRK